jgi:hypothetical protein
MRHHAPLLIRLSPWRTGQELLPKLLDILRSIRWLAESRFSSSTPGKLRNPPEETGTGHDHELQQLGESHYRDRQQLCFRRQLPTNCWSATVDGKLTAPGGLNLKAGTLVGLGTVAATVTSGASIKAGDSASKPGKLSIQGTFTQNSTGTLNITLGGAAAGTFGELSVTNGASPGRHACSQVGQRFHPSRWGQLHHSDRNCRERKVRNLKGTSINASEHFQVNYRATAVTLTVVSGP